MSLLAVGLSHRTAPVGLLERVTVSGDALVKLLHDVRQHENVSEALVVSTCNRVEVYTAVDRFHGGVTAVTNLLAQHSGLTTGELADHLYVHYQERAVQHLFTVACGLDSMVIGEGQILGQIRSALRLAQDEGTAGTMLNELAQHALRVGKRAHAETGIDRAGASLVGVGLTLAERMIGPIAGRRALVIGAGSMSSLAAATLARAGVTDIVIANRTFERAVRLAETVGGRAVELAAVPAELAEADLVISCVGAGHRSITVDMVEAAMRDRSDPLFLLDLALPHDVEPGVRALPGVTLVDLESMQQVGLGAAGSADGGRGLIDPTISDGGRAQAICDVRRIITEEVAAYLEAERASVVTPTVIALRNMAAGVVEAEIGRLMSRLPGLDGRVRDEVTRTVHRVVDKLLHEPTVRVKKLAASPGGGHYAEALRELFDLDPTTPEAVSRMETDE